MILKPRHNWKGLSERVESGLNVTVEERRMTGYRNDSP